MSALSLFRNEGDTKAYAAGETIEPCVSVPIENPTSPAAVAEPGPADDPLDPSAVFHGFRVRPRYQRSP